MVAVTLRSDGQPIARKPFTWSWSKLKNYEICPKRHFETDIAKSTGAEQSDQLDWGDRVHKTAADYFGKGTPVPDEVAILRPWIARIERTPGIVLVERKYALDRNLNPCGYFDSNVWYRGVCDLLKIFEDVALGIDWKTGKILSETEQLALMAACIFAHHPEVKKIRTEYIWLRDDATTREDFTRADMGMMWSKLFPRVAPMEHSWNTSEYLAVPGKMCANYCRVTKCAHHGKRY
jgi:hypothetical protein